MKIILILSVILLVSCNEKAPTELPEGIDINKFLPVSEGNYWYYQKFGFDNLGNRFLTPFATDSLYFDTTMTYLGEECYRFIQKTSEDNYSTEKNVYYRIENGKFYAAKEFYSENGMTDQWLKIYDEEAGGWLISSIITDFKINNRIYNGRIYSEVINRGKTSVEVNGIRSFALNSILVSTFSYQDTVNNEIIPTTVQDTTEYILGEDLGIVSVKQSGIKNSDTDNGQIKTLIDFKIENNSEVQ